jgi:hypothetical protein
MPNNSARIGSSASRAGTIGGRLRAPRIEYFTFASRLSELAESEPREGSPEIRLSGRAAAQESFPPSRHLYRPAVVDSVAAGRRACRDAVACPVASVYELVLCGVFPSVLLSEIYQSHPFGSGQVSSVAWVWDWNQSLCARSICYEREPGQAEARLIVLSAGRWCPLRLVQRGLRHRRSEGRQGAARRAVCVAGTE